MRDLALVLVALATAVAPSGCAIGLAEGGSSGRQGGGIEAGAASAESCEGTWLTRVEGDVRDLSGRNVMGAFVQFCVRTTDERLHCLEPTLSDGAGVFVQALGPQSRCVDRLAIRVLAPGGRHAVTYCPVDVNGARGALSLSAPLTLVPLPATEVPPAGDESAPRWVSLPGGLAVEVRPEAFWGDYRDLSAREVDLSVGRCFASPDDGLLGLWALGPEVAVADRGFPVRIPERTGLADGTEVELLLLGGLATLLADGTEVEEGQLVPFGSGVVRAGFVENHPGSEVPHLSWLGYRVKR